MAKKVTIQMKDGSEQVYENITKIEEDRNYEHVIGIRLYQDGELRAKLDYTPILHVEVMDQPDEASE